MENYYEVHVDMVVSISKSGKEKSNREVYLVDAQSVTEAEARVVQYFRAIGVTLDFNIVGAKKSRILSVVK